MAPSGTCKKKKKKIVMRYVDNKYDIHNLSYELWVNPGPLLPTSQGLSVLFLWWVASTAPVD